MFAEYTAIVMGVMHYLREVFAEEAEEVDTSSAYEPVFVVHTHTHPPTHPLTNRRCLSVGLMCG